MTTFRIHWNITVVSHESSERRSTFQRWKHFGRQILRKSPFRGEIVPTRVPLVIAGTRRPTAPFPHWGNFARPIEILDAFFWDADQESGSGRHNRYIEFPGFAPVLVTRDPALIRAIATETGDGDGQFDRDTLPSTGIARATGRDTLLFANGPVWKRQRKLAASPFGKTTIFQPELFHEFGETFRQTISARLEVLQQRLRETGAPSLTVALEPEIKPVMLELLVNNFFGAEVTYDELRQRYVPALERVIEHIVRDTVTNPLGLSIQSWPPITSGIARLQADYAAFDDLTSLVLAQRRAGRGLWKQFKSDAPDDALRSNLKVFLAGALEATTSYASWALSHLSRNSAAQTQVYEAVQGITDYSPEALEGANALGRVLDETLRLTPSLYFLPRRATCDKEIATADGRRLWMPQGTHILLDVWHANRHEDFWGVKMTGSPALEFAPDRWTELAARGRASKDTLHFGFGHGARICPGKHLGQLEVALAVGAFVKLFEFRAVTPATDAKAGVSTKPADGALMELWLRDRVE